MEYHKHFNPSQTPQSEPIPGSKQVRNEAGGFTWETDKWAQLTRFLVLGTEGGTYYSGEHDLTRENGKIVLECLTTDHVRAIDLIAEISETGRAVKNDPAVFALALAASSPDRKIRKYALSKLRTVCRIPTHLYQFVAACDEMRGWGRGLRESVANWFLQSDPQQLAYHVTKYAQRKGWSIRDLLRLSHPIPPTEEENPVMFHTLAYAVGKPHVETLKRSTEKSLMYLDAVRRIKDGDQNVDSVCKLIHEFDLPREVVPTEFLNSADVWKALLPRMPLTALIRNLGNMSKHGLFNDPVCLKKVIVSLGDPAYIQAKRVHPFTILLACRTYAAGKAFRGKNTWHVYPQVVDALDQAFYLAFSNLEATGKRLLFGLDVSSSMRVACAGTIMSAYEAEAAMAMALYAQEKPELKPIVMAFSHQFVPFSAISNRSRLDHVMAEMRDMPFGGTDCSLPMTWALQNRVQVDGFVVMTDNQTWSGGLHPTQALQEYRRKMQIPAKLIVLSFTADRAQIGDPDDVGTLDVVGLDGNIPAIVNSFMRG